MTNMTNPENKTVTTTPTIGVFDSGFGGLTVLRALLSRLLQIPAHHRPLRRSERAIPRQRAGSRVPGDCLQHRQRPGSRRH